MNPAVYAKIKVGLLAATLVVSEAGELAACIVGGDDRLPLHDYAAKIGLDAQEARHRLGAVGALICGSKYGTASLIGNSRTIVSSAHTLFYTPSEMAGLIRRKLKEAGKPIPRALSKRLKLNKNDWFDDFVHKIKFRRDTHSRRGTKRSFPSPCRFEVKVLEDGELQTKSYTVSPESVFVPKTFTKVRLRREDHDWLLARLESPVVGVQPLVPPRKSLSSRRKHRLLKINSTVKGRRVTMLGQRCHLLRKWLRTKKGATTFFSDCDVPHGSSGSPLLKWNKRQRAYEFHAMLNGSTERCTNVRRNTVISKKGYRGTYGIVFDHKFRSSVLRFIKK